MIPRQYWIGIAKLKIFRSTIKPSTKILTNQSSYNASIMMLPLPFCVSHYFLHNCVGDNLWNVHHGFAEAYLTLFFACNVTKRVWKWSIIVHAFVLGCAYSRVKSSVFSIWYNCLQRCFTCSTSFIMLGSDLNTTEYMAYRLMNFYSWILIMYTQNK